LVVLNVASYLNKDHLSERKDFIEMSSDVSRLAISEELLAYYRQRVDAEQAEHGDALRLVDQLRIPHHEHHKLAWEAHRRAQEVRELQTALQDFQLAVFEERKLALRIVAENDGLRIQDLKDRKKIRFLLSLSGVYKSQRRHQRRKLHTSEIASISVWSKYLARMAQIRCSKTREQGTKWKNEI
jgi:hypothetical protein